MDQTIGIGYQVDGVSQVVKANNTVIGSFEKVVSKVGTMTTTLSGFASQIGHLRHNMKGLGSGASFSDTFKGSGTSINAASKGTERLNKALADTPERIWAAGAAIRRLTTIMNSYSASVSSVPKIPMVAPVSGTGPGATGGTAIIPGGKATGRGGSGSRDIIPMVPKFMFMWRLGSESIQASQFAASDIVLGRSRQGLAAGLGQLSPLGFNSELKGKAEASAKLFSQQFWTVTSENYINALAQTASSFDVGRIGYKNLQRMNESAIKFSMVSKMTQEAASDLVQKSILALMTGLPEEVARKLNAGEVADVRGYGKVDLGGLSEKLSSQLAKTVAVSSIWGPGIQSGFRQALPTLVDKGWDIPSALALIGSYVDIGFQPAQGARGIKDIFEKEPESMARVLLYGTGHWQSESASLPANELTQNKKLNKAAVEAITPRVVKMLKNPDSAIELFGVLGEFVKKAEDENFDFNQFKFSKYFLPMIRQTMKQPLGDRIKYLRDKIADSTPEEAARIAEETMQDAGTAYERIQGAFHRLFTTMADSSWAHRIAKKVSDPLNFLDSNLQFIKNTKGKDHDQILSMYLEDEKRYTALYGADQAKWILKNALAASKGSELIDTGDQWYGLGGSLHNTTNSLFSLWDNRFEAPFIMSESAKEAISDFWESNVVSPLKSIDVQWEGYKAEIYAMIDVIPQKVREFFSGVNDKIDSIIPKHDKAPGEGPTPEQYNDMSLSDRMAVPFMSYGGPPPMPMPQQDTPVIQIDNRLHIDTRVIAQVMAEIIQNNRDVHYHGYGGDPMGFVT